MEKTPHTKAKLFQYLLLDSLVEMYFWYPLRPKVSVNLGFSFGIGPKPVLSVVHYNAQNYLFYFIKMPKIANTVIKMAFFAHGGISIKLFVVYVQCTYHWWNFKSLILHIFLFGYVNEVWISGVLAQWACNPHKMSKWGHGSKWVLSSFRYTYFHAVLFI